MRPMLAASTDGKDLALPMLASPKFDGVRAIVQEGVVLSRKLKPIPNERVQKLFGKKKYNGFDGELTVGDPYGPDVFARTMSGVTSYYGEPDVTFRVFDSFLVAGGFQARLARVTHMIKNGNNKGVVPVLHRMIRTEQQLIDYEQEMLGIGFEGVMLRSLDGPYKQGRATTNEGYLFKLKRFADAEALVLECKELQHNRNEATVSELGYMKRTSHKAGKVAGGVLGAMRVRVLNGDFKGCEFWLGGGFTYEQREQFWAMRDGICGKIVKFKYFPSGTEDAPRFPVFLGFRDPIDM